MAEQFRQFQESHAQDRTLAGTGRTGAVPIGLHRINIVTSFLKAAVPLTKIDSLQELSFAMADLSYPSTLAVGKKLAGDNQAQVPILMTQSRGYVADAIRSFRQHMNHQDGDFYPIMQMFKAVRMLCYQMAFSLNISRESVEQLRHVPLLAEDAIIHELQEDLPAYLAAAQDAIIDEEHPHLAWWKAHNNLPAWQNAARAVYSMLPSSAPAESVFSLLQANSSSQQQWVQADHLDSPLMLQYDRAR